MRLMIAIAIGVVAACLQFPAARADTIFTKDGVRLEGEIQEQKENYIKVKTTSRGRWKVSDFYDPEYECANHTYLKPKAGVICIPKRDVLRIEKTSDAARAKAREAHAAGLAALRKGDIEAAISGLQAAIAADPAFPDAYIELGDVIRFHKKDVPGAMEQFKKALELEPDNFLAHFGYALCYHDIGAYQFDKKAMESAVAEYSKAKTLNPAYSHVEMKLGAIPTFPEEAYAMLYHVANSAFLSGNLAEAKKLYEQVIKDAPGYAAPKAGLGMLLYGEGKFDEALKCLEEAVTLGHKEPLTLAFVGHAHLHSDPPKLADAIGAYRQALDAAASRPLCTMQTLLVLDGLATAHRKTGEYEACEEWAIEILALKPDCVGAHYNLACVDAHRNKKKEACKDLENAFQWALEQGTLKTWLEGAENDESLAGTKFFTNFRKLVETYKKKVPAK